MNRTCGTTLYCSSPGLDRSIYLQRINLDQLWHQDRGFAYSTHYLCLNNASTHILLYDLRHQYNATDIIYVE